MKQIHRAIIVYMTTVVAAACNNALVKLYVPLELKVVETLWLRFFLMATLWLLLDLLWLRTLAQLSLKMVYVLCGRSLLLPFAVYLYTVGLLSTPLSLATALLQLIPTCTVVFSILFFGDRGNHALWWSLLLSILGSWICLDPLKGVGEETVALVYILISVMIFGLYFSSQRLISMRISASTQMLITSSFIAILTAGFPDYGVIMHFNAKQWAVIAWHVLFTSVYVWGLSTAFRLAPASVLMPFEHSSLLVGLAMGAVFYHEPMTWRLLLGGLIIVIASLYYQWVLTHAPASKLTVKG